MSFGAELDFDIGHHRQHFLLFENVLVGGHAVLAVHEEFHDLVLVQAAFVEILGTSQAFLSIIAVAQSALRQKTDRP